MWYQTVQTAVILHPAHRWVSGWVQAGDLGPAYVRGFYCELAAAHAPALCWEDAFPLGCLDASAVPSPPLDARQETFYSSNVSRGVSSAS